MYQLSLSLFQITCIYENIKFTIEIRYCGVERDEEQLDEIKHINCHDKECRKWLLL